MPRVSFYVPPIYPDPRDHHTWVNAEPPDWPEEWPLPRVG